MNSSIQNKILEFNQLKEICNEWTNNGITYALCHGCFDPVHYGHILHFLEASSIADKLIVTLTPDKFINKGNGHPYFNENERLLMISALENIDYCCLNLWESAQNAILELCPNYYVKGIDYKDLVDCNPNIIAEVNTVKSIKGQMYFTNSKKLSSTVLVENNIIPVKDRSN